MPLQIDSRILLIHPERGRMGNYAFDVPTSPELPELIEQAGFSHVVSQAYPPREPFSVPDLLGQIEKTLSTSAVHQPKALIFITFNPLLYTDQTALYKALQAQFSDTPIILASTGTPYDAEVMPNPRLHLSLCSYRPATLRALVNLLKSGFPVSATPVPEHAAGPLQGQPWPPR